eukprot:gb/GECG01016654.1/.p1 GENE.gb/GECG01016654.1/~~gb/GECG01016654.1/.p1  ORF type:complete len:756 (+),score=93.91 gb/GECG01016654.1/:1-2268(+)
MSTMSSSRFTADTPEEFDDLDDVSSPAHVPAVYDELAPKGNSKSNARNYKTTKSHFLAFLKTKQLTYDESVCSKSLLGEYATYLLTHAKAKGSAELLKGNTAYQYFLYTKSLLEKEFPGNKVMKDIPNEWYSDIGYQIKGQVMQRCLKLGVPYSDKAPPVFRGDLIRLARLFLEDNTPTALMQRCAIVINWLSAGRAGEVSLMSWNSLILPENGEYLIAEWGEKKTSKFKPMTYFPDKTNYEIDYLHCMGSYLLATGVEGAVVPTGKSEDEPPFIFPALQGASPATKLSRWLKARDTKDKGTGLEYRGTSLRIGATNQMTNTRDVELHHVIERGGWDFTGVNNSFHYLLQSYDLVNVGGRALGGWNDCKSGAHLPRLVFMKTRTSKDQDGHDIRVHEDENGYNIDNFIYGIFKTNTLMLERMKTVDGLVHAMVASLLMYLDDVYNDWGRESRIVKGVCAAAEESLIPKETIFKWGRDIKEDFAYRNLDNESREDIVMQLRDLRKENRELKQGMIQLQENANQRMNQVLEMFTKIQDAQRRIEIDNVSLSPSVNLSPARKRVHSPGEERNQVRAPPAKKSLNEALNRNAGTSEIEALSGYALNSFLMDYVRHGLDNAGTLSAVCKGKQMKSKILKVIDFAKRNIDSGDARFDALLQSKNKDLTQRNEREQLRELAENIQISVCSKLLELETNAKATKNAKNHCEPRCAKKFRPTIAALAKRIDDVAKTSNDNLETAKQSTLFDTVCTTSAAANTDP